jgi:hypothetical protein
MVDCFFASRDMFGGTVEFRPAPVLPWMPLSDVRDW